MAQGRKICSNCSSEVSGARTKTCPACQHAFEFKDRPVMLDEAGNEVDLNVVRTFTYPDGYVFPVDPEKRSQMRRMSAPSGKIPMTFSRSDNTFPAHDDIIEWAVGLRQHYINGGDYITNTGLAYCFRQIIGESPADYRVRDAVNVIKNMPDIVYSIVEDAA